MTPPLITQDHIDTYQCDGVVLIKGLFADHVDALRAGVERNMAEPGPYAAENLKDGEAGRFFGDYCNWQRIPEFRDVIETSAAAQVFHDHVLVKEPGTSKPTPWHQDGPYYFVEGQQTISLWSPLDPVENASLRCVKGSHLWDKPVLPTRWLSEENFYPDPEAYMPVPDPDAEGMEVVEWPMEPGDAVAFNYGILHGARGNETTRRRRDRGQRRLASGRDGGAGRCPAGTRSGRLWHHLAFGGQHPADEFRTRCGRILPLWFRPSGRSARPAQYRLAQMRAGDDGPNRCAHGRIHPDRTGVGRNRHRRGTDHATAGGGQTADPTHR